MRKLIEGGAVRQFFDIQKLMKQGHCKGSAHYFGTKNTGSDTRMAKLLELSSTGLRHETLGYYLQSMCYHNLTGCFFSPPALSDVHAEGDRGGPAIRSAFGAGWEPSAAAKLRAANAWPPGA